jgi:hypothetical protein
MSVSSVSAVSNELANGTRSVMKLSPILQSDPVHFSPIALALDTSEKMSDTK